MFIIPAIDIMDGNVVRLKQGKKNDYVIYSNNPIKQAKNFLKNGAKRIHVVDLNAAFAQGNNLNLIKKISEIEHIHIEVGGGIRDIKTVDLLLSCGIDKIVIGTMVIKKPKEFENIVRVYGEHIIVAVDVENDLVKISGWKENTHADYLSFLMKIRDLGIQEVIITDIKKDGMLSGINLDFYKNIVLKTDLKIIVSGGIKDKEDIENLVAYEKFGIFGVVIGKAIYENKINLKDVIEKYDKNYHSC